MFELHIAVHFQAPFDEEWCGPEAARGKALGQLGWAVTWDLEQQTGMETSVTMGTCSSGTLSTSLKIWGGLSYYI